VSEEDGQNVGIPCDYELDVVCFPEFLHSADDIEGQYKLTYVIPTPGRYQLHIRLHGQHVHGSPYAVVCVTAPAPAPGRNKLRVRRERNQSSREHGQGQGNCTSNAARPSAAGQKTPPVVQATRRVPVLAPNARRSKLVTARRQRAPDKAPLVVQATPGQVPAVGTKRPASSPPSNRSCLQSRLRPSASREPPTTTNTSTLPRCSVLTLPQQSSGATPAGVVRRRGKNSVETVAVGSSQASRIPSPIRRVTRSTSRMMSSAMDVTEKDVENALPPEVLRTAASLADPVNSSKVRTSGEVRVMDAQGSGYNSGYRTGKEVKVRSAEFAGLTANNKVTTSTEVAIIDMECPNISKEARTAGEVSAMDVVVSAWKTEARTTKEVRAINFANPAYTQETRTGKDVQAMDLEVSMMHPVGSGSALVLKVGRQGRERGEFVNPQGVCYSDACFVLVADSNSACVQVTSVLLVRPCTNKL